MLYEEYERKILRIKAIRDKILKYKFLILGVLCVIFSGITWLLVEKGNIEQDFIPKESYVYGEEIAPSAKAFISSTYFEYRQDQHDDWSTEKPIFPGSYEVRTVAYASFGGRKYGDVYSFAINVKPISVTTGDSMIYGDNPVLIANATAYLDRVQFSNLEIEILDVTNFTANIRITDCDLCIYDGDGMDVTFAYDVDDFVGKSYSILLEKRPVSIEYASAIKVYDGTPLYKEEYSISEALAYNDREVVVNFPNRTDYGTTSNQASVSVLNENNEDVTRLYDITVVPGTLEVLKRDVSILSRSAERVYDGTSLDCREFDVVGGLGLATGDAIDVISYQSITDAGSTKNVLEFGIVNSEERNVSDNYNITAQYGTLTVRKRPLRVSVSDEEETYCGQEISKNTSSIVEGSVVGGHVLSVSIEQMQGGTVVKAINAGEYVSRAKEVKVFTTYGEDITYNYDILEPNDGSLTINRRPIELLLQSASKPYDATPLTCSNVVVGTGGMDLVAGHSIVAVETSGERKDPGVQDNEITKVKISDGQGDVTDNYSVTTRGGTLEVYKRKIVVSPINLSKRYDGTELVYPGVIKDYQLSVAKWYDAGDEKFGNALYGGCTLYTGTTFDEEIKDVGSTYARSTNALIKDAGGNDVTTEYYDIVYGETEVRILPREITVVSKDKTGSSLSGGAISASPSDCYIFKGSLVAGDSITYEVSGTIASVGSVTNQITKVEIKDGSNNTIGYIEYDENGNFVSGNESNRNYNITVICGKLELT